MNEIWKAIPGYEGLYEVSNTGQIKSLERIVLFRHSRRTHPEIIMKQSKNIITKHGYMRVTLCKNGLFSKMLVHKIVCLAFIGEAPKGHVVNHKDLNKSNNYLVNLEYVTTRQNVHHQLSLTKKLPIGVSKHRKKYKSVITINGKAMWLGSHDTHEKASEAYQNALLHVNNAL